MFQWVSGVLCVPSSSYNPCFGSQADIIGTVWLATEDSTSENDDVSFFFVALYISLSHK
jgi:hypothetical protein